VISSWYLVFRIKYLWKIIAGKIYFSIRIFFFDLGHRDLGFVADDIFKT
jgi:hypothetical protein